MGLLDLFKKKNTNSFGENLDRLTPEGELPWGWTYANKEFVDKIQTEVNYFRNAWIQSKKDGVLKEYASLKSFVLYLNDVKKLCASKGECFTKWFDDIIANQEYINKLTSKLRYIEDNIDELLEKEKRTKKKEG